MVSVQDRPIVPHREQLIYLLTEAAELEHGLMCSYLFAAFSLRHTATDLEPDEKAAVVRWRAAIRAVAMEEMLHLALVQNLLTSIGGAPHFQRPNFPVALGLYPSGLALHLRRFDEATLDHFVYLERPEGAADLDGEGYEPSRRYDRGTVRPTALMASAEEYPSVGSLYRGIQDGFGSLAGELGEARLFLGDPAVQTGPPVLALDGLHRIVDLVSAHAAIDRIIEQGEGGRQPHETSHYARFQGMRAEYAALRARRPTFEPAYPVADDPVMNVPVDPRASAHVEAPEAARVLDLGNAAYGLMVQLLARLFSIADSDSTRPRLAAGAITLMTKAISPIADLLASLPIGRSRAGENAGLTFTLPRSTHALPQPRAALVLLRERAVQLSEACQTGLTYDVLHEVGDDVRRVADTLASPP